MYKIKTKAHFDAAHFLKNYDGKCSNLHGHRWKVEVTVQAEELRDDTQNEGMVMDFSEIKPVIKELCDSYDHSMIYETGSLKETTIAALLDEGFLLREVAFRPTAENFAKEFFDQLRRICPGVCKVEVFETPSNSATYEL